MNSPEVCVLKTDGINCDMEMAYAFEVAGGQPEIVHVNQVRNGDRNLSDYNVLAIPGGFSYGDDIVSGKVLANELTSYLSDQLSEFVEAGKPVIGVCNGFQILVRTGLLPNRDLGNQQATLAENEIGRFECRWIDLAVGKSVCKFVRLKDFEDAVPMQIAHGEGRFYAKKSTIEQLQADQQIVFRYTNPDMSVPDGYPANPNGSVDNIAGICDPSGLILGMMPHPERSTSSMHPDRKRTFSARSASSIIFSSIVNYAKKS